MPRRVATGVDPKRLAMILAVLSRHAGLPLGSADVFVNVAGGVRIEEPGGDLGIALAVASAARGTPVRDATAAFGEIGLTGRLRPATQASRRVEECRKLGLSSVVAPAGTEGATLEADDPRGIRSKRLPRSPPEQGFFVNGAENPCKSGAFKPILILWSLLAGLLVWPALLVNRRREGVSLYKVGDKVVYPHHGAGTVVKRERRDVLGEKREYLTIKILHNDMTVNVPAENAERIGLRKVIDEEAVKKVVKYLTSGGTEMPKNWNRRFKHNRDKMKTGDIYELAEVVRNLSLRDGEKGLSTGEKQMYVKAKKILASELMYAKNLSEEDAFLWLEDVLTGPDRKPAAAKRPAPAKKPPAAKPKTPAAA